ncbi:MAG: hypothetical protein KKC85_11265 [Gammaproteobacteria bacterium]|nr:hypothetical protein [Gammaproteobacteria bacterium]MBU1439764.1 hypothetical protein [Gammaproteobacteria bacterium]MBU2287003.1 hypothetical protein [Gammaproteobacteria bacterium]
MFSFFVFVPDKGAYDVGFLRLSQAVFLDNAELPGTAATRRRAGELLRVIKPKLPSDSDWKAWESELEYLVCVSSDPFFQEFSAWMLLHASKNASHVAAREELFYDTLVSWTTQLISKAQHRLLTTMLKLIPDVEVMPTAQLVAGLLRYTLPFDSDVGRRLDQFVDAWKGTSDGRVLISTVCTAPEPEILRRIEWAEWAMRDPDSRSLIPPWMRWAQMELSGRDVIWMEELHGALSRSHASGSTKSLRRQLNLAKVRCRDRYDAANRAIFLATAQALEQGVEFGRFADDIRAVLLIKQSLWQRLQARWKKAELARSKASELPAPRDASIDAAYNWPIEKLVEWIDGPVSAPDKKTLAEKPMPTPSKGKQPARGKNAGRGREARGGRGDAPNTGVAPPQRAPFGSVHFEGLRRYAAYMLADLQDMAELCAQYKLEPSLKTQLEASLRMLDNTAKRADPDRDISRQRFADADALLTRLRGVIKEQKADEDFKRRFAQALADCMASAPLAYGRHFGGEIDCPARPDAWPWVYETYHDLWLPEVKEILLENHPVSLEDDQALALYVTGSSNSGYAFCISVHLWRRRAGSSAPPVPTDSTSRRMDTEHWIDTRIPCSVFHVPSA